jgi:hypothetical protein
MTKSPLATIRVVSSLKEIDRSTWDSCANPLSANGAAPAFNPFVTWDFLQALEEAGCVGRRSGWSPRHLVLEEDGVQTGFMPCYAKAHSQGEYVFDWGWADAYERAGGDYYPKLQACVPFTPVTGPRLLVGAGADAPARRQALAGGLAEICRRLGLSSAHVTFLGEGDRSELAGLGYLQRTDKQFHWQDEGYGDFEGFLGALAARKRKALRRERRDALADDIEIVWLRGAEITEADWDAFFDFYIETGSRKWGSPYLNRKFFSLLGERLGDRVLLIMARRNGRWIAGALNLAGSDTLYGRYWGSLEDHPFLHFEVCYYQAIDFALAHGLMRVEAGAQGAHKLARGYLPHTTHSAHYIVDPGFRRAVANFLTEERLQVAAEGRVLATMAPFRRGDVDPDVGPDVDRGSAC